MTAGLLESLPAPLELRRRYVGGPLTVKAYRRGRLILGIAWAACLVLGPYWVFEFGSYHGQVKAYREEHFDELRYQEQKARASGVEAYAIETGQTSVLLPLRLQELESSEESYFAFVFFWAFIIGGVWKLKQQHRKECPEAYNAADPK
jgi:hypothetical protein